MHAIRVHEYGGPETLEYESIPNPEPAPSEVVVDVRAAGVNPIDWLVRKGYTDDALEPSLPYTPGWDLSGVVSAVGTDVSAFEPGDAVFGLVSMPDLGETYAEYAAVPASDLIYKPQGLDHTTAGGIPMVGLTAWRALFEEGNLREDDRVLVHAAAGGVGHLAVQFARHVGAHVIGTASARNREYLQHLGVDRVVDYREQAFEAVIDDVDLVVDAIGGETLERSIEVCSNGGCVVTLPEPPAEAVVTTARQRDISVRWFSVEPNPEILREILLLVQDGVVQPTISDTFPLREAAAAHKESEDGHVRGKLVVEPTG